MKCDRRWWNDGRLAREQDLCPDYAPSIAAQMQLADDAWRAITRPMAEHIRRSMDELWRKLMDGDQNGKPWHEVLEHWLPETSGEQVFFGSPAITCSRQINITPEQVEKMARGLDDKP